MQNKIIFWTAWQGTINWEGAGAIGTRLIKETRNVRQSGLTQQKKSFLVEQ